MSLVSAPVLKLTGRTTRSFLAVLHCLLLLSLASCGGGGGGGGGDDGAAAEAAPTFTLSASTVDMDVVRNSGTKEAVVLVDNLSIYDEVLVDVPGGTPSWMLPVVRDESISPDVALYSVRARIFTNYLSQGSYSVRIKVTTRDTLTYQENGSRYFTVNVNVTEVQPLNFSGSSTYQQTTKGGDSDPVISVSIVGNPSTDWTLAAASSPSWLSLSKNSGTGPDSVQVITDTSLLATGSYDARLVLNANDPFSPDYFDIRLVVIEPSLSVTTPYWLEGGAYITYINGIDGKGKQSTATFGYKLTTGTNAYPYTLNFTNNSLPGWLNYAVVPNTGTIDESGIDINLSVDYDALAPGAYSGYFSISTNPVGRLHTHIMNLRFYKELHQVYAQTRGLAFARSPAYSKLTDTVRILSSYDRNDIPWQASADQAWVTVTPSGLTGDAMTVTIDASGLTPGNFYSATVSVTSSDPDVANTETLAIGFDYRTADPSQQSFDLSLGGGAADAFLPYAVASPTESLVFIGVGNQLGAYSITTGALVRDFGNVVAENGPMTISDNGLSLFIFDASTNEIVEVNSQSGAAVRRFIPYTGYTMRLPGQSFPLHPRFVRPDAVPLLISAGDYAINTQTATNSQYYGEAYRNAIGLTIAPGDKAAVIKSDGLGKRLTHSAAAQRIWDQDVSASVEPQQNAVQSCIDKSKQYLFTSNAQTQLFSMTNVSLSQFIRNLATPGIPMGLTCEGNGIVVAWINPVVTTNDDLYIFETSTGNLLTSFNIATLGGGSLYASSVLVSADSSRIIAILNVTGGPDKVILLNTP